MRRLFLLLLTLAACKEPAAPPEDLPEVEIRAGGGPFSVTRQGVRPTLAAGELHVFVSPTARDLDLGLPGIAFGGPEGPRYGLLAGYFAPRILAPDPEARHRALIETSTAGARIRLYPEGADAPSVDATVRPLGGDRAQVVLRGAAAVAIPADRAQVQGRYRGQPAFATAIEPGGDGAIRRPRADRVEVISETAGAFAIDTDCPRPSLVRPVPRGSTSVWVLALGRAPPAPPLWSPEAKDPHPDLAKCPEAVTSTLTVRARVGDPG